MVNAKIICPLMGKPCIEDGSVNEKGELEACRFWVNVIGKNPQTGAETNNWDCAIAWTPILLVQNAKISLETAASMDALRHETNIAGVRTHASMTAVATAIKDASQGMQALPEKSIGD